MAFIVGFKKIAPPVANRLFHLAIVTVLLLLCAHPALAQRSKPVQPSGAIEGDLYFTDLNGETTPGVSQSVYLLPSTDRLYREHIRFCDHFAVRRTVIDSAFRLAYDPVHDSIDLLEPGSRGHQTSVSYVRYMEESGLRRLLDRSLALDKEHTAQLAALSRTMRDSLLLVVRRNASQSMLTGLRAHYRFAGLDTGFYEAFTPWSLRGVDMPMWAIASVERGKTAVADIHRYWAPDGPWDCANFARDRPRFRAMRAAP
jgi:hypothetical protein